MKRDIHKKLLVRLFLVWLGLSVVIGTGVYIVEMQQVDDFVVSLALTESERISDAYHRYYYGRSRERLQNLSAAIRKELQKRHFVFVEIYSENKEEILFDSLEDIDNIILDLERKRHDFLMRDRPEYMKIRAAGDLFLKIMVPLRNPEDTKTIGHFEGVYRVEEGTMRAIAGRTLTSIVQVVVVLFITSLVLYPVIIGLQKSLLKTSRDLAAANVGLLEVLGSAIAKRDSDTNLHNYRVTIYAIRLAEEIGVDEHDMQGLIKGALLHDVGKIGISDAILLKPGNYTAGDLAEMQSHVKHGVEIIGRQEWLKDAIDVIGYHHEKYDGSGYAAGLRGSAIPLNARIFTIADVFDALTSKRPYKEQFAYDVAIAVMQEGRGTLFDPELLDTFLGIVGPLYVEINAVGEDVLESKMDALIRKYFRET